MTLEAAQTVSSAAPAGRVRRAMMTWTMGAVYSAVTLLVGFIATPLLLKLLTPERIGAARASAEWLGYLVLADLGLGSAVSVLLIRARKSGEQEVAGVTRLALNLLALVALVITPLGLLLAYLMPQLVKIDPSLARELQLSVAISVTMLAMIPLSVFRMVLETAQRGYVVNAGLLIQSLLITGLSLLLAWRGWGLIGLSLAGLAGAVTFAVLTIAWSTRLLGSWWRVSPARIAARDLWKLSWPLAAAGAGNRLNLMTDSIVVGYVLGSTSVAVLFLTQRIILLAGAQINALNNATWAALAELLNAGKRDILEARIGELLRLIVGLGVVLGGSVAAYDGRFVSLWVGAKMYDGDLLAALTVAGSVVFGFLCLFSWIIDMQGDTRRRLAVSTIGAILNLVLSVIFVRQMGLAGVALGTVCAYLLTDAWHCPMLVCKRYGVQARVVLIPTARALLAGLPWAGAVWVLARLHLAPPGWAGLVAECGIVGACALGYCWWLILTAHDRDEWRQRLARFRAAALR